MERCHPTSPDLKKFKSQQSAGKVMVTVLWDSVGVILVDFVSKGVTINSDVYIVTKARIRRVQPALKLSKVLLQHDNARPHTSLKTHEVINSFGWTISHAPYLPDLALSDFHLLEPFKESLREQHFSSDEKVKTAARKWLKTQSVEFYNEGICALVKRWEKWFGKQEITSRSNYEILMLYTFL